jgi:hypothetical protein
MSKRKRKNGTKTPTAPAPRVAAEKFKEKLIASAARTADTIRAQRFREAYTLEHAAAVDLADKLESLRAASPRLFRFLEWLAKRKERRNNA